eukprot:2956385-Alexandrium_andersonii.AAC.1
MAVATSATTWRLRTRPTDAITRSCMASSKVSTWTSSTCGASRNVAPLRTVKMYRPTEAGSTAAVGVAVPVAAAGPEPAPPAE